MVEPDASDADRAEARRPALDVLGAGGAVRALCARALRADDLHLHPVVPGYPRRPGVPDEGPVAALVRRSVHPGANRRRQGRLRPLDQARDRRHRHHRRGLVPRRPGVPPALPRRRVRVLSDDRQPGRAGSGARHRHRSAVPMRRHRGELVHLGARRAAVLDAAVRRAGDVRGDVALRPRLGGSRARSRRHALADHPAGGHSDPGARPGGGRAVRLHAVLRRVRAHAADRGLAQHAAAGDLEHDAERHLAVALCARHRDDHRLVCDHRRLPRRHRAHPEAARRARDN